MPSDHNTPPLPEPLAYFLTWTTYGTWLPGDERGWVRRPGNFESPIAGLRRHARQQQTETELTLAPDQRLIVERTIAEHCGIRGWHLWTVRARTNHVHVVVTAKDIPPDFVMEQFKAWSTRRLKEHGKDDAVRRKWWTERGSRRVLNDEASLEQAIIYVRDFQ